MRSIPIHSQTRFRLQEVRKENLKLRGDGIEWVWICLNELGSASSVTATWSMSFHFDIWPTQRSATE